tara:strand:+ start:2032 stop:3243 length:1212 start_codon:yes stop_codon:yes gene_type:complete
MAVLLGNVNQGLYGGVLMEIPLTRSQTFVPPRNGTVNIICIGAGGSGAYCRNGTGTIGTGGGAGGLCIKEGLDVTTSGSFTITIGAGGASVYASGSTSGTAGGNTTVAGTGLSATLTANGGGGGVAFAITENGAAGGAGGTASNGTINRTGGAGGTVGAGLVTTGNRALMELSTGGGAVAILTATGYAGGSITLADGGTKFTNDMYLATGGAGIGGRGGGVHSVDGNLAQNQVGFNGGGASYAGYDKMTQYDWVANGTNVSSSGIGEAFSYLYRDASLIGKQVAVGGAGNTGNETPGNGGGGRAQSNSSSDNSFYSNFQTPSMGAGGGGYSGNSANKCGGYGGAFAGGGGTTQYQQQTQSARTGDGGVGGGGGGMVNFDGSARIGLSGHGGPGMVFIHYTAYA